MDRQANGKQTKRTEGESERQRTVRLTNIWTNKHKGSRKAKRTENGQKELPTDESKQKDKSPN